MNIFNLDNAFYRGVGKMVDLVWLNLLTVICCVPVITAGASLTAMYHVSLRMVKNEESSITKNFFKSFKENFRSITGIWLGVVAIFCFYAYDLFILKQGVMDDYGNLFTATLICISIILIFVYLMCCYIFPLMARYDNTVKQTLKNAVLLLFGYFPRSLCMGVIYLFPIALTLLSDYFIVFWFLLGLTFSCYICSQLLIRMFEKIDGTSEEETEGE